MNKFVLLKIGASENWIFGKQHSAVSDLGLHCFLGPVFSNIYGIYGINIKGDTKVNYSFLQ